jgi:hypothetical protein
MIYAYDLDGTLVDSEPLVRRAYELAGANPPIDFFGKPFHEWSSDWQMHARKQRIYIDLIAKQGITALPLTALARITGGHIVTGASIDAVETIVQALDLRHLHCHTSLSVERKAVILNYISGEGGIMFEDSLLAVQKLKELTKWTILHVV